MTTTDAITEWPRRPLRGDPMRQKFATALTELLKNSSLDTQAVAGKVFGRDPKTKAPKSVDTIRDYLSGGKFPNVHTAKLLAKCFDVPLARLLTPKGPLIITQHPRVQNKGAPPPPPPPLELPKDAPPITLGFETYKKDARFAVLSIHGTCEIDVALHVIAMLHPK
jgi:hypothetical protein